MTVLVGSFAIFEAHRFSVEVAGSEGLPAALSLPRQFLQFGGVPFVTTALLT